MVVCPNCRSVNDEERSQCAQCGASLDPGYSALLPVRRTEEERPPLELKTPKPPSRWRPIVLLAVVGVAAIAYGGYTLLRPDPCDGTNFESDNFGYCILVPEGWEAGPARFGADVTLDQFAPPTEAATVVVEAVDLETGVALEEWSEFIRTRDEEAGLTPGPASEASLDGIDALQWDVTVAAEDGETFQLREVVAVVESVGWRITLNDLQDGFDTTAVVFQDMLDSWRFA